MQDPSVNRGLKSNGGRDAQRSIQELPHRHSKDGTFCVTADLLIPGLGEPIQNGSVVVQGKKITHVGRTTDSPAEVLGLPTTHVKVLMPGLWDCHVHLIGLQTANFSSMVSSAMNQIVTGARCTIDLERLLDAGLTSVREVAGYGLQLRAAIEEGSIVGPTIYSSNTVISMMGGHGDYHTFPKHWYDDACSRGLPMTLVDGVPGCLKAVRMQLRAGAHVIKICTSGGFLTERDGPRDQEFSLEEIQAMVEEAGRARRIVAAHCHGKAGIMAALHAGVKTIEHGSYLDEEAADLMLEKGAILVGTRLIIENGLAQKDYVDPVSYEKLVTIAKHHWTALKLAVSKGVTIATGTDTAGTVLANQTISFSLSGKELAYHVKAGMTPLRIQAATANGPLTLGPQAPMTGILKPGYDADFIGVDENPLEDIDVLGGPGHVTDVRKLGKCYKSPGHPVSSLRGSV